MQSFGHGNTTGASHIVTFEGEADPQVLKYISEPSAEMVGPRPFPVAEAAPKAPRWLTVLSSGASILFSAAAAAALVLAILSFHQTREQSDMLQDILRETRLQGQQTRKQLSYQEQPQQSTQVSKPTGVLITAIADSYLTKYPVRPMKGLWDALNDLLLNSSVAIKMVTDPRCGLERRALSGDVQLSSTPRSPTFDGTYSAGLTPLMMAVLAARSDVAEALLELGASYTAFEDRRKFVALHLAATVGSVPSIMTLLAHGAAVDVLDVGGCTPLCEAAWNANIEAVEVLLANGASTRIVKRDGTTIPQCFENSLYIDLLSSEEKAHMRAILSRP